MSAAAGPGRHDEGFTLVEFVVAMGLFGALIAIFMIGIANMTRYTIQGQNSEENATEARSVYRLLDQQVREASEINAVSTNGGRWYLEFRTSTVPSGTSPTCTQWRFDPATDVVTFRIFNDVASPATPVWRQVTDGMANTTAPVAMSPADSTHTKQRLTLNLTIQHGKTRSAQISTVLVARNTDTSTITNTPSTTVCRQLGQP